MLRPLRTESHSSTRGSVQRCSHRRVAAYACGTYAASRSCPPRPRPGNADFSIHDLRAVEREPGSWEGAAISFFMRIWSFLPATRLFVVGVVLLGVRGRRAISPVFCRRRVIVDYAVCGRISRVKAALPSRSLGGRESCSSQGSRFGKHPCCCSMY